MKTKLNGALFIAVLGSLIGCQQVAENTAKSTPAETKVEMSVKEQEVVKKLQWVKTADAKSAAKKALSTGAKPELIAFSGRGLSFPGLTHAQYENVKEHVTHSYAKNSGDVIHGDTHLALRKQLHTYASEYNTIIYTALLQGN